MQGLSRPGLLVLIFSATSSSTSSLATDVLQELSLTKSSASVRGFGCFESEILGKLELPTKRPAVASGCLQDIILRLRGGWEEDDEDESEYEEWSDEYDEDESSAYNAAAPEDVVDNPHNTWAATHQEGRIEGLVRANEGLTDEEVMNHPYLVKIGGGFSGSCHPEVDRRKHRYFVEGRARGPMVEDSVPPLRVADVYGLGNWTYLHGEVAEPAYTDENLDEARNILKAPPEELPELFHYPMGNCPIGRNPLGVTLASRFANWTGPLPGVWEAAVYSPRGRIFAYSFSKDVELDEQDLLTQLGTDECFAFFMDMTERLYGEGLRHTELDGTFEPGPACLGFDVECEAAEGVRPEPPTGPAARDRVVPDDHPFVFQAVRAREDRERIVCRAGRRCWAKASNTHPRWAIDVGLHDGGKSMHVVGEGSGLSADFATASRRQDADDAAQGSGVSELSGQWVLSNRTYGSFSACRLEFLTSLRQVLLQVHSGPWLVDDCDLACAHGVCVQTSFGGQLSAQRCRIGGTGPNHTLKVDEPGHARFGLLVDGNGNATLRSVLLRDIGLRGGSAVHVSHVGVARLDDCRVLGCRVALQLAHFPDVELRNCVVEDVIDAAFWSECYGMVPQRFHAELEELQAAEFWTTDEKGRTRSSLKDDPRNDGTFGNAADHGPDGDCRMGRLSLQGCAVDGRVWLTTSRPFILQSDNDDLV